MAVIVNTTEEKGDNGARRRKGDSSNDGACKRRRFSRDVPYHNCLRNSSVDSGNCEGYEMIKLEANTSGSNMVIFSLIPNGGRILTTRDLFGETNIFKGNLLMYNDVQVDLLDSQRLAPIEKKLCAYNFTLLFLRSSPAGMYVKGTDNTILYELCKRHGTCLCIDVTIAKRWSASDADIFISSSTLSGRSHLIQSIRNYFKLPNMMEDCQESKSMLLQEVSRIKEVLRSFEDEDEIQLDDYMDSQPELNENMRAILVDWLIEVHNRFRLMPETLYLAINLVDRFLCLKAVPSQEFQLLGIGAMLIACKYKEILAPQVKEFVCISDNVYTYEQILRMEKVILGKLEWNITVPTPYMFLTRFIKASIPDNELENMVCFLAELALMNYTALAYCPSMVAASAVYVARCTLQKSPAWTETLKLHTKYSESQLLNCAKLLVTLHSTAAESKLQAAFKEYSKPEHCAVALSLPAKSILTLSS